MNSNTDILFYTPPESIQYCENVEAFAAQAEDDAAPHVTGVILSPHWKVWIEGTEVPVLATPVTFRGPHSFCQVIIPKGKKASCRIQPLFTAEDLEIRSQQGEVDIAHEQEFFCFDVRKDMQLTIEANHVPDHPLSIFFSYPDTDQPDKNDPNVLYFDSGLHEIDWLELQNYQTVYLECGAFLKALPPKDDETAIIEDDWAHVPEYADWIRAKGKRNLRICGKGIIDTTALPWHARRTLFLEDCENVTVEGISFIGAAHWTLVFWHCKNVIVRDVKIFGYRQNSDGIDLVNCEQVRVEHCYLRTGDDAICLKGMMPPEITGGRDVFVADCTVWTEKARSLGIIGETRGNFSQVCFADCIILHGYANWTRELGSLCVVLSDGGTVEDVVFRDISILQEDSWIIDCMIRPDFWSTDHRPGRIRRVRFINLTVPQNARINLQGFDEEHSVEQLSIDRLHTLNEEDECVVQLSRNRFVRSVTMN